MKPRPAFPLRALATACICFGAAACATVVDERFFLHPTPDGPDAGTVAQLTPAGYQLEEHRIPAMNAALYGVLLRHPDARQTVLYFGGNMFRISQHGAFMASRLAQLGVNIFLVDHRGYGKSTGEPTLDLLEQDALASYDYLRALPDIVPEQILVHGQSLGSFFAGHVADRRPVGALVLESSATTTQEWVRHAVPVYAKPFIRVHIDEALREKGNLEVVRRLRHPLLILVGRRDNQTPAVLSQRLFRESVAPDNLKRLHVFPSAGHNDVLAQPDFPRVYRDFLELVAAQASAGGT